MVKAAGYIRVSTKRQAEQGLSLDEQERKVREYINAQGWELTEVFIERGVSGKRDDRPELGKLMASLDQIDRLVIPKLDRLGRSNRHLHETFERLDKAKVGLVSLRDNIDTSTPMGKFMRALLAALAEFESEIISERVSSVSGARSAKGLHHGRAPFGYVRKGDELVSVEPDRSIMRRIFAEAAEGASQRGIAERLNTEKVKASNGKWAQSTIARLLINPAYIGKVRNGDTVYEGNHEAIIDATTWAKVQAIKDANREARPKGGGRPPMSHLFMRGHLKCGHCGSGMAGARNPSGSEFYRCLSQQEGRDCAMNNVPREIVDSAVFDYFSAVGIDLEATREQLVDDAESKRVELVGRLQAARRAEQQAAAAVERVRDDYTSGDITAAEWKELRGGLKTKHEQIQEDCSSLEEQVDTATDAAKAIDKSEDAAIKGLASIKAAISGEVSGSRDLAAVRAALSRLFECFVIARVPDDAEELSDQERMIVTNQAAELDEAMSAEDMPLLEIDKWSIIPQPRLELVEDIDVAWRPILRREAVSIGIQNDARSERCS